MAASGLTPNCAMAEVVGVLDRVYVEMSSQTQKILVLEGQLRDAKEKKSERKDSKESRAFQSLATWCGGEKPFVDREFKLQQFVRSYNGFEEYLEWVKRQDEELTLIKLTEKAKAEICKDPEVDLVVQRAVVLDLVLEVGGHRLEHRQEQARRQGNPGCQ